MPPLRRPRTQGPKGKHGDLSTVDIPLVLKIVTIVTILISGFGCATVSPLEAECLDRETLEWYTQCRELFYHQRVVWYQDSKTYTPRDRRTGIPRHRSDQIWEIRSNDCPIRWDSACGTD